jgi:hypothetical protein
MKTLVRQAGQSGKQCKLESNSSAMCARLPKTVDHLAFSAGAMDKILAQRTSFSRAYAGVMLMHVSFFFRTEDASSAQTESLSRRTGQRKRTASLALPCKAEFGSCLFTCFTSTSRRIYVDRSDEQARLCNSQYFPCLLICPYFSFVLLLIIRVGDLIFQSHLLISNVFLQSKAAFL